MPMKSAFVHEFGQAKFDYSALLHQQSLRELRRAIWTLDEERARTTLLRAIATSICIHMNDPQRFASWCEAQ